MPPSTNDEVRTLAHDYLFKVVDEEESAAIRERVRKLGPEEAEVFHQEIADTSHFSETQRLLFDAAFEYSKASRRSFLDFTQADGKRIMSEVTGIPAEQIPDEKPEATPSSPPSAIGCIYPYVSCPYVTSWNKTLTGTTCSPGTCSVMNAYDRVGNAACEFADCDYRLMFPRSSATSIDGRTAAADCVINYYGGLIAYSSGATTYALSGVTGITWCGLANWNLSFSFQVR